MDTFRDSAAGQLVRVATSSRLLRYPDEHEPQRYAQALVKDLSTVLSNPLSRWSSTRNLANHFPAAFDEAAASDSPPAPSPSSADLEKYEPPTPDVERNLPQRPPLNRNATGSLNLQKLKTHPDTKVVEFLPNDPEDPQNWTLGKKLWVTFLIDFLTFCIYIGSAIYTAGLLDIEETFHVSQTVAVLGLTLFVIGYGVGPMVLAPLAEAPPIGRTPVYVLSSLAFVFLNFGVVYASNIGMLLAFRFITGFVGSPVLATGGSSLADIWSESKRAYAIGIWGVAAVCGPVLGPLVGGFAAEAKGWTWTIWELIWLNAVCLVLLVFCLPETSSATILLRRASRLRKALNDDNLRSVGEIEVANMETSEVLKDALLRPFSLMLTEPILFSTDLYLGLIYAILYCWFEAFPIAFVEIYGFTTGTLGLAYLGILVGALATIPPYFVYLRMVQEPAFKNGTMTPEMRLQPALVGAFLIPICLFWFGWTSRESVHWIVPIIGSSLFSIGALLLFMAILNYQGDAYPKYVGSALAGNDFFRSMMGGAFPVFATPMFRTLGLDWGSSLLGFLSIAFIPIPFAFYYYGRRIRLASKKARHDI